MTLFSGAALQKIVAQTIKDAQIPDGKRGAVITNVDANGLQIVTVAKVNDRWKIEAAVSKPWSGDVQIGAAVQFTW